MMETPSLVSIECLHPSRKLQAWSRRCSGPLRRWPLWRNPWWRPGVNGEPRGCHGDLDGDLGVCQNL